jgi:hypothetical protein
MTTKSPGLLATASTSLSVPAASTALSRVIEDQMRANPELRTGWAITAAVKNEAEAILSRCDALLAPAPRALAAKWLATLGALMPAGRADGPSAEDRLRAILQVVDFPEFVYTEKSLRDAAARFKFFPSVAELTEFFRPLTDDIRNLRIGAARVAAAPLSAGRPGRVKTEIEKLRAAELAERARVALREGSNYLAGRRAVPDAPPRRSFEIRNPEIDGLLAGHEPDEGLPDGGEIMREPSVGVDIDWLIDREAG